MNLAAINRCIESINLTKVQQAHSWLSLWGLGYTSYIVKFDLYRVEHLSVRKEVLQNYGEQRMKMPQLHLHGFLEKLF